MSPALQLTIEATARLEASSSATFSYGTTTASTDGWLYWQLLKRVIAVCRKSSLSRQEGRLLEKVGSEHNENRARLLQQWWKYNLNCRHESALCGTTALSCNADVATVKDVSSRMPGSLF
jgi:hypothetical protein